MAPHLFDLPTELLELILCYVPSLLLVTKVCGTCRRLRHMLRSESFWKRRYASLVREAVPPVRESLLYWQHGCIQSEFSLSLARRPNVTALTGIEANSLGEHSLCPPALASGSSVGGLDCVHLMFPEAHGVAGLVAAGSRDRCVYVWRRRSARTSRDADSGRSLRGNVVYAMEGHQVRHHRSQATPNTAALSSGMGVVFEL